jgi:hypothetical protein
VVAPLLPAHTPLPHVPEALIQSIYIYLSDVSLLDYSPTAVSNEMTYAYTFTYTYTFYL